MASPTFDLSGLTKVYARTSRSVVLTADGLAFAAGTDQGTVGSCPLDLVFGDEATDKFCLLYEIDTVNETDGSSNSRTGYIGFADSTTDPFTDSNGALTSAGEWGLNGSVSPAQVVNDGAAAAVTGLDVGDGDYVLQWFDLGAKKAWTSIVTPGSPATITHLTPDGGSLGDPVTGANPQHTWASDNSDLRWGIANSSLTRVTGFKLLTAAEADAIGLELPEGWALAGEAATPTPDVPTSVAIALDTGTTVDVTWDAGSGDSIELEIRSSLGAFTGTPTHTGLTDDGAHPVDVGGAGTWYVKARRVTSSVASDWSSAASTTIGAMVLTVKNGDTKVAPCGIVATIWDSTPPEGLTMDQTTAYWQWSLDDVIQEHLSDRLTMGAVVPRGVGGEVKIECFWYSALTGEALGYGVETITVAPEPTYDDTRYLNPTTGSDANDGLTAGTPKASLGGVLATLDLTADRERLIVCGGSGRTVEAGEVVNLGVPDGSFIVDDNGDVAIGACVKVQQHQSGTDPSRHVRLAFLNMPVDNPYIGGAAGALDMTYYGGSHASRARGFDLLWTAPYAHASPTGLVIGIGIVHQGYAGDSGDYTSPTMDWPGTGDAVIHIADVAAGNPNFYGTFQFADIRCNSIGTSLNHVFRSPRSKALVVSPLSASRCVVGPQGTTGDHVFKLHARGASATGMDSRLDTWGVDIIDCDIRQQTSGGTSVSAIAVGSQNVVQDEFSRGVRVVRPRLLVPPGQTAGGNRCLALLFASADQVSIYDPIIDYEGRAQIVQFSLTRTAAAVAEPSDPDLFTHRFSVLGGSMLYVDAAPAIVACGGSDDLTGHTIHFLLRDIAAECTSGSSVGIELQDNGATVTCDADGIVTNAATFAQDEGGSMTLAEFAAAYGGNARSANVDPEFTDAEAGDFGFDAESPLYEAGGTEGLAVDALGEPRTAPRDIGAIEESSESTALTAPTSLAGVQVSRTAVVTLTYDAAPEGATGIQARHRYGSADWSGWADLGTPDGSSDMTAAAVQSGTLSVQARFTGDDDPSPATSASVAMLEPAPEAPSAPSLAQVGPSTVARVTIATVARADDGYLVEASTTGAFSGEETEVGTLEPGDLTIDDDIGAFDVERWYRVTALNEELGDSSPGTAASITLVAPELDAPTDLAVVASGLVGAATWTDNSEGLASYVLWRRQEGDVEWDLIPSAPTEAGAEEADLSVPSAGTWEIAVAIEGDLDESDWSIVSVAFVDLPAPPERVAVGASAIGGRAFLVQWELPESEIPYVYALVEWTGSIDGSPIDGGAWQYGGTTLASILAYLVVVPENATNVLPRVTLLRLVDGNRLVAGEPTEADAAYGSPIPEVLP